MSSSLPAGALGGRVAATEETNEPRRKKQVNSLFTDRVGAYFVSFAVIEWTDVFTRNEYKDILIDSLRFCQKEKGMEIFAWCIMTNHVHLIFRSSTDYKPELLLGDFKRYTSKAIVKAIQENAKESRRENLLSIFKKVADKSSNVTNYQFWRHDNKPIELFSNKVIFQKINYIHQNPVVEGYVFKPEEYRYSSAVDYAGNKGILDGVIVCK